MESKVENVADLLRKPQTVFSFFVSACVTVLSYCWAAVTVNFWYEKSDS